MNRIKVLFILILLCMPGLLAQTGRGTLTGIVTDSTGASVPGAAVTVTDAQTNGQRRVETSAAGVYTVTELPFGSYAVAMQKAGFRTAEAKDIVITVNQVSRLDVRLEVGEVHQSIEVRGTAEMLQKDSATIQTNYDSKFMAELPLALGSFATRSPEAFTFLTPGVVGTPWLNSINGGQTYSNSVLLDGASAGRTWHPGDFDESAPSVDALGEFNIKTNSFSAEYGRSGSAVTSFAYKSGTNRLHGALYEFERNEALDAAGFYHQNTVDRKHDFGGTIGGPVYLPRIYDGRNRTFFFVSLEGFLTHLMADAAPLRVPSELQKQGDFSELLKLVAPE